MCYEFAKNVKRGVKERIYILIFLSQKTSKLEILLVITIFAYQCCNDGYIILKTAETLWKKREPRIIWSAHVAGQ